MKPRRPLQAWLLLAAIAVLPATLPAQTVWRCGADGSSYQQTPCPGGQALDAADARSDAQRHEAAQRSQREAALAQALRSERQGGGSPALQDERAASAPQAARPKAPAPDGRPGARHSGRQRHAPGPDKRIARTPKPAEPRKSKRPAQADKPRP